MPNLSDRTILITGAGGFIGSHLVERCIQLGASVRALVRYNSRNDRGALEWLATDVQRELEVVLGDIRDIETLDQVAAGCDYICHLAAQIAIPYSYRNPRDFIETNVIGSLNVAQAGRNAGVQRIINTSTSEVYGTAQIVPITEQHPLNPQSPYAASKVGADKMMDACHLSYGLPVVTVRPFNTYGPRQSARAVIPTIVSQALHGGPLRLGSLAPRRDLTFVEDTVEGFVKALTAEGAAGRTIQLGTGRDVSVGEIVEAVGEILGRQLEVEVEPARVRPDRSEVMRLVSDPQLARQLLGWTPQVALREGLSRTIEYVERHLERYRTDMYVI